MAIKFTNNASATLAGSITTTSTSVTLSAGQGGLFPTISGSDYFFCTLINSSNVIEIIKVTARTGDVLTVVRGQDGSTANAYSAGDRCELRMVAGAMTEMIQRDGSVAFTGNIDAGTHNINNVVDPTTAQQAATKNYVDAQISNQAVSINTVQTNLNTEITNRQADTATRALVGGSNASGTWPISVSGNAGSANTVAWTGVSGRPTNLSQFTNDSGYLNGTYGYQAGQGAIGNCGNIAAANCNYVNVLRTGNTVYANLITSINCYNCNCQCCCCC